MKNFEISVLNALKHKMMEKLTPVLTLLSFWFIVKL